MEMSIELRGPVAESPKVTGRFFAPKIVLCSNYADLRTEDDKLIATVTWISPVTAKVLGAQP